MDDISTLHLTIQQQQQRITALEELLRRNEGSLTAALSRIKDAEIGMNTFHKLISQIAAENGALGKEMGATKQRCEIIDRSWRSHCQQSETALWNELRNNKPPAITQDPTISRMLQDLTQQRAQLSDMEIGLNRVTDAQANDSNALRLVEQHVQGAEGQLSELMTLQREGAKDTIRRFEQIFRDVGQHKADTDRAVASLRQQSERQLRDASTALEQHSASLAGFQQDAGASIRSIREEVATGLAQVFESLRNNETATKTLEQILRAEVQTRAQAVDQTNRKVAGVEQTLNSRLSPLVNNHHADISRLWDAIRSSQHQRQQTERLDSLLAGVDPNNTSNIGAGAGAASNINRSANNISRASAGTAGLHPDIVADQIKDLEISTSERFDLVDSHVLQLAETLKRAHSGVEEQVESLASRFGRLEMRLEQVASRRDQQQQKEADRLIAMMKSNNSNNTNKNGDASAADGNVEGTAAIIREVVDTRLRVDRVEASVEEVKFDVSDLLDAISAETTELTKRLESLERKTNNSNNSQQQQNALANVQLRSSHGGNTNVNNNNNNQNTNVNLFNNNNINQSPLQQRPASNSKSSPNIINNNNNNKPGSATRKSNQELLAEFASGNQHTVIDTSGAPQNDDEPEL